VATRTRDIAGFAHSSFVHGCRRHDVYRAGSGPAALGLDDADLTRVRERTRDGVDALGLRFTAGVMLAATAFSLLVPALERGTLGEVLLGFVLGSGFIAALDLAGSVLAGALAFAAGAMLYVVVDELVPESHGHGHERAASLALLGGFALMMALDNAFG
jgi:zinc transporter ZupT